MSRRPVNATGRSGGIERYVRLNHWLLDSEAYRHASPTARALLVELYRLYNSSNNGQLFLSAREAAKRLAVSKNFAHRALRELQHLGFIALARPGSFDSKGGHAAKWRLTEFGCAGDLPTKDFMRWRPTTENQKPGPRRGTGCPATRDTPSP